MEWEGGTCTTAKLFQDKRLRHNAHAVGALIVQCEVAINEALHHFIGKALIFSPLEYRFRSKYRFAEFAKCGNDVLLIVGQSEVHGTPPDTFFSQLKEYGTKRLLPIPKFDEM